jgi:HK97 family phage prohead protease
VVKAPNRVELRYSHQTAGAPYGFGIDLVEDPGYLLGSFRVAPSEQGDQLLSLVRDDQLAGVSVGYVAGTSRPGRDAEGPLVERMRVKRLPEVSLTPAPAFSDGAQVLAVREQGPVIPVVDAGAVERERLYWARMRGLIQP